MVTIQFLILITTTTFLVIYRRARLLLLCPFLRQSLLSVFLATLHHLRTLLLIPWRPHLRIMIRLMPIPICCLRILHLHHNTHQNTTRPHHPHCPLLILRPHHTCRIHPQTTPPCLPLLRPINLLIMILICLHRQITLISTLRQRTMPTLWITMRLA